MISDEAVAKCVAILSATFRVEVDAALLESYRIGLSDLDDEQLKRATGVAVKRCQFMPKPCDLMEFARTGGVGYEAAALLDFERLERALDENNPEAMSPLVSAIVSQLGGFEFLRRMPIKDFNTWKRKDFIAAHMAMTREDPARIAAIAGPASQFGRALSEKSSLPSRDDIAAVEDNNRQKLLKAISENHDERAQQTDKNDNSAHDASAAHSGEAGS